MSMAIPNQNLKRCLHSSDKLRTAFDCFRLHGMSSSIFSKLICHDDQTVKVFLRRWNYFIWRKQKVPRVVIFRPELQADGENSRNFLQCPVFCRTAGCVCEKSKIKKLEWKCGGGVKVFFKEGFGRTLSA